MPAIAKTTPIEDLVGIPGAVQFMVQHGLPCLVCGEPAWGTFEDVARRRGKSAEEIEKILSDLNLLIGRSSTP